VLPVVPAQQRRLADSEAVTRPLLEPGLRDRLGAVGRERVRERFLPTRELEDHVPLLGRLT